MNRSGCAKNGGGLESERENCTRGEGRRKTALRLLRGLCGVDAAMPERGKVLRRGIPPDRRWTDAGKEPADERS